MLGPNARTPLGGEAVLMPVVQRKHSAVNVDNLYEEAENLGPGPDQREVERV